VAGRSILGATVYSNLDGFLGLTGPSKKSANSKSEKEAKSEKEEKRVAFLGRTSENYECDFEQVQGSSIPVMHSYDWVNACIEKEELVDTAAFVYTEKNEKRKRDDEESMSEELASITPSKIAKFSFQGTYWQGVCIYEKDSSDNFELYVEKEQNNVIEGTIEWPNLEAKTKFRGTCRQSVISFEEYEAIYGEENIGMDSIGILSSNFLELNSKYEGNIISATQIKGSVSGIYQFTLTKSPMKNSVLFLFI
jgi:hypothetical protein